MKTTTLLSLTAAFCLSIFAISCRTAAPLDVQKRRYTDGWYIAKRDHGHAAPVAKANTPAPVVTPLAAQPVPAIAQAEPAVAPVAGTLIPVSTPAAAPLSKTPVHHAAPLARLHEKAVRASQTMTARAVMHKAARAPESGLGTALLIIIAIFIPPLAVLLYEGLTGRFLLDLILWLLAVGVYFIYPIGGLLALLAIIYAIVIVLGR